MTYGVSLDLKHTINIQNIIGCVSSLFNIETTSLRTGIIMRYKRVSNFSEMDSKEAFILDLYKKKLDSEEIIESLVSNFGISQSAAQTQVAEVLRAAEVVKGVYKSKQIKAKTNPGFLTQIRLEDFTNTANIQVSGINNIYYLLTLPIYLDSLLRITQDPSSTGVSATEINELCLKKSVVDAKVIEEIIPEIIIDKLDNAIELGESIEMIQSTELGGEEDDEGFMQTFFGSDDDDDDDDDSEDDQDGGGGEMELGSLIESNDSSSTKSLSDKLATTLAIQTEKAATLTLSKATLAQAKSNLAQLESSIAITSEKEALEESKKPPTLVDDKKSELKQEVEEEDDEEDDEEDEDEDDEEAALLEQEAALLEQEAALLEQEIDKKPTTTLKKNVSIPKPKISLPVKKQVKFIASKDEVKVGELLTLAKAASKPKLTIPSKPNVDKSAPGKSTEGKEIVTNLTGLSLANPNPFEARLKKRDPKLFKYDIGGKYTGYNRICPSNVRRQPVILTEQEKERIDKEHPGSYAHALKYGTDPENQHWFICPRYWSLKDHTSLTDAEVKSGKYGNVIPGRGPDGKPVKSVPANTSIFEFNDQGKEHIGKQGEYIEHYPGYIKSDSHPDGYCLPCCFKQWNSQEQQARREDCSQKAAGIPITKHVKETSDDYIVGPDKFPIKQNRLGFLPIIIQTFLKTDNQKCQISNTNIALKPNHLCLLRQGVQSSRHQSFVACISDAFSDGSTKKPPTIDEMKQIIINSITLDIFISVQNGSLLTIFGNKSLEADISKYDTTFLYKNTDLSDLKQLTVLKNAAQSFENFHLFLLSNTDTIDYTYLWDIICMPNELLFPQGINLVILEIINNDLTDNVNIICPTNHFALQYYDSTKKSLILLKNEDYYEPVYAFEDKGKILEITRLFSLSNPNLMVNLKQTIEYISGLLNKNCKPLPSQPDIYKFKQNIILVKLLDILKPTGYKILKQVMNYNGKIIGIMVENDSSTGYIPCYPSSVIIDLGDGIEWIDNVEWQSYTNTREFLTNINQITNQKVLSLPKIKVIEDGLIIGILTETNQFVGVLPTEDKYGNDLESLTDSDYIVADTISLLSTEKDTERIKLIKNIQLETNFYNAFRNTIRILIGRPEYSDLRQEILNIINQKYLLYQTKISLIDAKLRELTGATISFIIYTPPLMDKLKEISTCLVKKDGQCTENFCLLGNGDICSLLIPKNNLITPDSDNEIEYFGKIADELVRYSRIKHFILNLRHFYHSLLLSIILEKMKL